MMKIGKETRKIVICKIVKHADHRKGAPDNPGSFVGLEDDGDNVAFAAVDQLGQNTLRPNARGFRDH